MRLGLWGLCLIACCGWWGVAVNPVAAQQERFFWNSPARPLQGLDRFLGWGYSHGYHYRNPGPDSSYYNPYNARNTQRIATHEHNWLERTRQTPPPPYALPSGPAPTDSFSVPSPIGEPAGPAPRRSNSGESHGPFGPAPTPATRPTESTRYRPSQHSAPPLNQVWEFFEEEGPRTSQSQPRIRT